MISDELFFQFNVFFGVNILYLKILWIYDTLMIGEYYIFTIPLHSVSITCLITFYFKAKAERNNILA
jgi:hypothetical protein